MLSALASYALNASFLMNYVPSVDAMQTSVESVDSTNSNTLVDRLVVLVSPRRNGQKIAPAKLEAWVRFLANNSRSGRRRPVWLGSWVL